MNKRQKQKKKEGSAHVTGNEFEIMKFLEFNINDFILCKTCKHVHASDDWIMNDFSCPTKGCNAKHKIVIPWNLIKSDPKNKSLPDKPEIGKYYNPHF